MKVVFRVTADYTDSGGWHHLPIILEERELWMEDGERDG